MTVACTEKFPTSLERSRVLLVNGAEQDERTCRMIRLAKEVLEADGIEIDVLDPALHQGYGLRPQAQLQAVAQKQRRSIWCVSCIHKRLNQMVRLMPHC